MRPFEIVVAFVNLLAFSFVFAGPQSTRATRVAVVAPATLMTAVAQGLMEGPRWQLAPAYFLAGLPFVVWVHRGFTGRAAVVEQPISRGGNRLAVGVGAFALLVSISLPTAVPVFKFPDPSGPYEIGTTTYHWVDRDRHEIFAADDEARREMMVQVWYPAEAGSSRPAPYVVDPATLTPELARLASQPNVTFRHLEYVTTHATAATNVAGDTDYPVLIFLPGANGFRQMNTFQVEELVSHGYIVAAFDQPFTVASVVFPGGRHVPGLSLVEMRPLIRQSYQPAPEAPHLYGRELTDGIVPYLAQDVSFGINQLRIVNDDDPDGLLTGRLDMNRVGVFGVSLGGIVASEACRVEPRLTACLVMDAPMPTRVVAAGLGQPTMWITRDAAAMRDEGWPQVDIAEHQDTMRGAFASGRAEGYFVEVPGMFHTNLTDVPAWSPLSVQLGLSGPIGQKRAHDIVNSYSLAFFDRHLAGHDSSAFDDLSARYPDIGFDERRP